MPAQLPLRHMFPLSAIDNEPYVWRFVRSPGGQLIIAGERLGFYEDNRWQFVLSVRKVAIRDLLVDGSTLWIVSEGELGHLQLPLRTDSRYESLNVPALARAGVFWHLKKSGDGLVAVTTQEIWSISRDGAKVTSVRLPPDHRRLIAQEWPDRLILSSSGGALWEWKDGAPILFQNPLPDPSDTRWYGSDGSYVLTERALYRREAEGWRVAASFEGEFKSDIFASVVRWGDLVVAATTARGPIFFDLRSGRWQLTKDAAGLGTELTTATHVDTAARMWLGTHKGITVFESLRYGHALTFPEPPQIAARNRGLFVGSDGRGQYFHDDGTETIIGERVWSFRSTAAGPVLGLWNKTQIGNQVVETRGGNVFTTIELPGGRIFSVAGANCYSIDPATGTAQLVPSPRTNFFGLALAGGSLWAAASDGRLYRSRPGPEFDFQPVASFPAPGEPEAGVLDGTPIFAAPSGVFHGADLRPVGHTAGLRNSHLAANADGLWLVGEQDGNRRLGRLVRQGDAIVWETIEAKGLAQLNEVRSIAGADHVLTFSGDSVVMELNTNQLTTSYRLDPPRLAFTYRDARSGADTTRPDPPAELGADDNSLAFSGTLAFDEFGEQPRFERRLLPSETAWVPTRIGETVSYPSLSPRTYALEVRTTHLGHTGVVAAHAFTVLPPWYATRTATAGYVVFTALGFYGLYRLRTHNLRRRTVELERIVEERTHALREASAAKTEFLASMSHEIRNPMNGVIGLVDILRDQPASPRQADTLRLLHHCADQLRNTVDDILDFSKIEAGRVELEAVSFDLRDTLEAAAASIAPGGDKITFLDQLPQGIALVGDVGKIRQIFANYLSNALKYGGSGGRVILRALRADQHIRIEVVDFGPGLSSQKQSQLFEPFNRLGLERSSVEGHGVGLAIAKRLVELQGGAIGVISSPGEGATFWVNLPHA